MLRRIQQLQVQEDHARKCTTVDELRIIATNPIEDPVRAIMRLYGKAPFARGVHLTVFDDCSRDEFVQSSKGLQGLTHADQQSLIFRVTVWGADVTDWHVCSWDPAGILVPSPRIIHTN
ncbi:hypothetical protein GN958_ATG02758 [Phytophthora infestans]|uniref:Uncharacterized protein n=1 Tax=Phytophthora infestans TaxID=4787 RepID=A0A8S9V9J5_PHYIN|nr:hypothetical protein GN958_ATG02758 [Phytophthora infestans]